MLSKVYKFKFMLALLLVPFLVSADPPGWEKTETLFSHTLIIPETVVPEINGVPIVTGDWVGVFYNDAGTLKCGGSVEFTAGFANAFAAYGDDPLTLEKDGFGMSESFIWRVYKTADLENHWCEATLAATDPQTFMAFGTSTVESVVGPTFAVTASADPTLICGAGGDVTLSAFQLAGDPVETWEWYDNGTLIGTASQTTVFVDETTTFQVVATSGLLTTDAYVTVTVVYATAGSDEVYCDTQTEIELDGAYASGYVSLTWSGGTGSFNDPFALNPIYYPSAGDIASGAVTLSLNVITLDCGLFSDDIEITFQPSPVINIIPENAYVCYGQNFDFAGLVEATNYSLIQWGTTNGSGDFSNENILDPTYEPSSLDWLQGCIEIFVNASPIDPCTISDQDFFYLCFVSDPYADAGAAIPSICEGDITEYHFADAMVSFDPNYPGTFTFVSGNSFTTDITRVIEWTTTGSGTFDNPAAITPTYTFSQEDMTNGGLIEFTLTAYVEEACGEASATNSIFIQLKPTINILEDSYTICEGENLDFTGEVETNGEYSLVEWYTTNGSGIFVPNLGTGVLEPIYEVSSLDYLTYLNGDCIKIYVVASPNSPCDVSVQDSTLLCFQMLPVVVAGEDATVCSHELYTTDPDVQYSNGPYLWTVDPVDAGVFADPTALVTTFDPNAAYEGQTVTLTLTADPIGPCTDAQSGSMDLYIEYAPWVNAGPDMTICSNESAIIEGECLHVEFTMWATTGDGYFVCPDYTCEQVEYFPGPGDLAEGCVTLILIGYPLEPCTMYVLDKMELCFDPAPIADAGPDQTICEGEIAQLDATAENYCGIQWVTLDGTGTFSDETILNPTYTPSFQDVISGTVNLTMIVAGCGACDYSIETTMALTIQRIPFITFPQYPVICEDGSIDLTGVEVENYESVLWTTMGDGTFDDAGSVTATYTPGPGDASAGAATLCLTANPIGPCLDPVQECVVIEIQQLPTINIIPDSETICYGDVYTFVEGENIEAANYSALQWAGINAAGTFDNETILTPTYTPSPLDWAQGCVQLLVVASPIGPCEVSSEDFLELCFQAPPVVDAGEDATICEDASYQLNPIIENGGTVLWETSGSGSFDDPGLATATYTPSQDDIDAGYVVLTITVGGLATCDPVSDSMTLYFQLLPIANAGGDQTVCEMLCAPPWTNGIVYLGGIVENACGSLWTTAGDGTFSDPANLNAVYTLGEADITAGSVLLTLTAIPCDPCTVSHTDDLTVTVQYFPIADAGPDQTICEGQTAQLDGDAEYETGVFWDYALLGEGDGTFDNKLIEDPVYTPGTEDIENGFVELIMVAFPISPCTYPDADIMTLYITRKPVPNAGPDATICEGETFTPQATVLYSDSVYWTCDPPDFGTFDDPELIQPTFTPVMTGNVTLILEAFDGSECAFETYVSTMNLFVNDEPQISFGFNGVEAGWNAEFGYCFGTEIGVTVFAQYGGTAPYNVTYTINGGTPITVNGLEVGDYLATPQVYEPGTYNIVVTSIEDANGCFAGPEFLSYCTATVVVWEELTLTCPDDILVGNDSGLCGASVEFEASISGEPDPITVTYMVGGTVITSPYFFPVGVTTVDVTAENICSTLTCSFTVTVEDTETPAITCVPDQTKITDPGVCSYTVVGTEFDPTVVDNCLGSIELTNDYNNLATLEGAAFEPGSIFVIWTAADPAGNIATCGFTVTVTDEENPTIACPADIIQTADQGVCYAVITALGQPVVSDNCEVFEVYNNAPVDFDFPVGITTVTWTVVDIHGNFATCDQFITVTDNELPTITCPDDITQTADAGECFATITDLGTPVTNDNCGVFEVYNNAPATFPVGLTTVTWTVVDIHGNVATCEQLVTVTDDELPTITCPDDITQTADAGECFATITDLGTPVTNDNCGVFEVYNDAPATFPVGLTTVTWTVVDIHGNQANCEQLVTVTDDELPTITCPPDILVSNDLGYCGAYIQDLGQPVFNDNCGIASVTNDAPLGAYYPVGETVVTWTVVDVNGNQATCEQTVTVTDDEAPVITLIGLDYIEICQGTPYIDEGASAYDNCDGDITAQIVVVNPVNVDVPGTYTITYNVTDAAGNPAIEVTRTVVVRGLPTVDAGPDVTICKTELIFVTDGSATDYQSVEWVSAGTGFFDDPNALITNYNPSDDDKALGTVTLTLKAYGFGVCANAYAEDFMLLTFQEPPTADAGDDATICEGDTYPLAGEATYYSALLWETAGDGEFTPSADILNPTYVPGPNDIINGGVVLTFTAFDGVCDDAVDEMTLNIVPVPVIEPMADIELGCDDWSEALDAWLPVNVVAVLNSAASIGTVNWTTTGAGVVTNVSVVGNMVYATYNLDENNIDKWANVVTLTLEVNGPGACGFSASASVDLLIPTQLIKITSTPRWWGISSYVDKSDTEVPEVMEPAVLYPGSDALVIQINKGGQYYWPEPQSPINQLGNWQPIGYKAKFKNETCIPIYGSPVVDQTFEVGGPALFTYVPVLTNVHDAQGQMAVETLFDGYLDRVLLMYEWNTGRTWTEGANPLDPQVLSYYTPGNAYLLARKVGTEPFTIEFPDIDPAETISSLDQGLKSFYVANSPWNEVDNTGQPHFIMFSEQALAQIQPGDILGAFNNSDFCVGVAEYQNGSMVLVPMGVDPMNNLLNGFETGENMNFRLYRPSSGETFDLAFTYDSNMPNYDNTFEVNGLSIVTGMTITATAVGNLTSDFNLNIFPNPVNDVLNIVTNYTIKSVSLVNYVGQTVYNEIVTGNNFQINVSNYSSGMYVVSIETAEAGFITRRITIK